jgi:peptide/nickel transport system permease protein
MAQAAGTVFGVMLLTFVLFRLVAGDVSAQYTAAGASQAQRDTWRRSHGLDKPLLVGRGASPFSAAFWDSQFADHLADCVTFRARSYRTHERLTHILLQRAPYSLAITVPALALSWLSSMIISCLVAHWRGRLIDRIGVLLSVLGMCVPFLAYMIVGQWLLFRLAPQLAWGLGSRSNVYVPVAIAVVAGLGGSVRFYRTVILEEIGKDYVRGAQARGASSLRVMFIHVLPNCMLPILTHLVMAVPFLIMGNLLLERFFGIPGLGDLLLSSWVDRDVPVITALTFLTAVICVAGYLITDILYAVFDPRVRLR